MEASVSLSDHEKIAAAINTLNRELDQLQLESSFRFTEAMFNDDGKTKLKAYYKQPANTLVKKLNFLVKLDAHGNEYHMGLNGNNWSAGSVFGGLGRFVSYSYYNPAFAALNKISNAPQPDSSTTSSIQSSQNPPVPTPDEPPLGATLQPTSLNTQSPLAQEAVSEEPTTPSSQQHPTIQDDQPNSSPQRKKLAADPEYNIKNVPRTFSQKIAFGGGVIASTAALAWITALLADSESRKSIGAFFKKMFSKKERQAIAASSRRVRNSVKRNGKEILGAAALLIAGVGGLSYGNRKAQFDTKSKS